MKNQNNMKKIFYFIVTLLLLGIWSCADNAEEVLNDSTEVVEEVYTDGTVEDAENCLKYWEELEELFEEYREWVDNSSPKDTSRLKEFEIRIRDLRKKYNIK